MVNLGDKCINANVQKALFRILDFGWLKSPILFSDSEKVIIMFLINLYSVFNLLSLEDAS